MIDASDVSPITIAEFFEHWTGPESKTTLYIDARSESEVAAAGLPEFYNVPILRDESRHRVGLVYKNKGKEEAIALGYSLEGGKKEELQKHIKDLIHKKCPREINVTCWRGGLRSSLMVQLIQEITSVPVFQIEGGYKAIRSHLLQTLTSLPEFLVLSGPTGSMKTELLAEFKGKIAIDLEALAHHRGSSFGYHLDKVQPSQSTFENRLFYHLMNLSTEPVLLEDESRLIGKIAIPQEIKDKMRAAPVVLLKQTLEERVVHIFNLYIKKPLEEGRSPRELLDFYLSRLEPLKKRLGGQRFASLSGAMETAFAEDRIRDINAHEIYLKELLVGYYDRRYLHSFQKTQRHIAFEGTWKECQEWLMKKYDSRKQSKKVAVLQNSQLVN